MRLKNPRRASTYAMVAKAAAAPITKKNAGGASQTPRAKPGVGRSTDSVGAGGGTATRADEEDALGAGT
jgi:hypothetical protein